MRPYIPDALPLEDIDYRRLFKLAADANAELARFDGLLQGIPNSELLLTPLTTNEVVLSSRIEGTQATLNDVLEFEAGASKTPALEQDVQEIINYRKAIHYSQQQLAAEPVSLRFIRELHQMLMDSVRGADKSPEQFRQTQNYIGQIDTDINHATFIPPDPIRLISDLEAFERYLASDDIEILLQTAVVHAQFELIHPFNDGNGRIGRLLIPLFLYQKKKLSKPIFYISDFLEKNRDTYYACLRNISSSPKDWNGWIDFFFRAVSVAAKDNCSKVKNILALYDEMKSTIQKITHSQYVIQIIDALFSQPIFRNAEFAKKTGIKPSTTKKLLLQLKNEGVLHEIEPARGRISANIIFPRLLNITEGREIF
ncbi:MAG: Fic family protein [Planctomycetaceae bacterium]|jgi:Fic family protein|nr:Fic family protein [Planctomycetaceae bacterium]